MNCDEFLSAMEIGGPLARWRARRHAARCGQCAALFAKFAAVKRELARAEPLSPRAIQLWEQAADEPVTQFAGRRTWVPLAGGLAAAACVVLLVVRFAGRQPGGATSSPPPPVQVVEVNQAVVTAPTIRVLAAAEELDRLSRAADRLDAELDKLRLDAQRIEARRQVAMTLERFHD
jgi:negative regulator of sigma E activity